MAYSEWETQAHFDRAHSIMQADMKAAARIEELPYGSASNRTVQGNVGLGARQANPDSLASAAPIVLDLAGSCVQMANHLEASFGIFIPESDNKTGSGSPALLDALRTIELRLRETMRALENISRHVNG